MRWRLLNKSLMRDILYNCFYVRGVAQWLARLLWEQDVAGSTPATPTIFFAQIWAKKHEAVRLRFMHRRCASWHSVPLHTAIAVLHKSLTIKHCSVSLHNMKQLHFISL